IIVEFYYLTVLVCSSAFMDSIEKKFVNKRCLKFVRGIVLIYIGAAVLQTSGVFAKNDSIDGVYRNVKGALLPAMLMIMLLKCDIRSIIRLGPRMIGGYLIAVVSIML